MITNWLLNFLSIFGLDSNYIDFGYIRFYINDLLSLLFIFYLFIIFYFIFKWLKKLFK